jgi:hypothetical protein
MWADILQIAGGWARIARPAAKKQLLANKVLA